VDKPARLRNQHLGTSGQAGHAIQDNGQPGAAGRQGGQVVANPAR